MSGIKRGNRIEKLLPQIRRYKNIAKMLKAVGREHADVVFDTGQFTANPAAFTERLCAKVDIPYFSGKEDYRKYETACLFGSRTQQSYFQQPEAAAYNPRPPIARADLPQDAIDALTSENLLAFEDDMRAGCLGPVLA